MGFEFRMKTGFFETKIFDLLISKGKLVLLPKESDDQLITIPEESILNITLKKSEKSLEMEIQTHEKIYQGLFDNKTDYEKFINQMKENINKKILCEYEGYSAYAGGIIGYQYATHVVNCYNAGQVINLANPGNTASGGIAGFTYGQIFNVFNAGYVTGPSDGTGGISGSRYDTYNFGNCFFLDTSASGAMGRYVPEGTMRLTENQMKGLADSTINTAFFSYGPANGAFLYALNVGRDRSAVHPENLYFWTSDDRNDNNGYPVFNTQDNYVISFNSNGGSAVAAKTVSIGDNVSVSPGTTLAESTFNGWFTALSGGDKINFPYTPTDHAVLYAQWQSKSNNADLQNLSASSINLTPLFNSATTSYTANVSNSVISTTISAVTSDDSATVSINGNVGSSKLVALNVGSNVITVEVTAEDGVSTRTYTVTITRAGGGSPGGGSSGGGGPAVSPLKITTASLPDARVGQPYNQALTASGGSSPYTWTAIGLPAGLTLSPDGNISGTPAAEETSTVTFQAADSRGRSASIDLVFNAEPEPITPPDGPPALTDIAGHWAEEQVKEAVSQGFISGYPGQTFQPDKAITRAEFAVSIVKALKLEPRGDSSFLDCTAHWARPYISTAAGYGIIKGYSAQSFGSDDLITREQMAAMTARAVKLDPAPAETAFTDSWSISAWARGPVAAAVANGLVIGYPDQTFRPQGNATRAEAVTVIGKALHLK